MSFCKQRDNIFTFIFSYENRLFFSFQIHWKLHGEIKQYYTMTVWILAGNYISFTTAAGLIRLHMPGVKKYRV